MNGPLHVRTPRSRFAYLKLKGPDAQALFHALSGERVARFRRHGHDEVRRGVHLAASNANLVDRFVVEIRLLGDASVTAAELRGRLFHSLTAPRLEGTWSLHDGVLTIAGDGAVAAARLAGLPGETMSWRVIDLRDGVLDPAPQPGPGGAA